MALELGLFLGANLLSESKKPCLVMDTERYRYRRFCSDLSGFDPSAHGGDVLQLICVVRDWLRGNLEPNEKIPGGEHIFKRYKLFLRHLREFCEEEHLNPDSISYYDSISSLQGWLEGKGLREKQTSFFHAFPLDPRARKPSGARRCFDWPESLAVDRVHLGIAEIVGQLSKIRIALASSQSWSMNLSK